MSIRGDVMKKTFEKGNKNSKFKMSKRRILTVALVFFGALLTVLLFNLSIYIFNSDSLPWIEQLYYSVQIVTSIYVVIGTVIGIWQYCITARSEMIKNENEKLIKAVELAEYYKDNIIIPFCWIKNVYNKIGATAIIRKVESKKMVRFDYEELVENFQSEDICELKKMPYASTFVEAICEANSIYNLNVHNLSRNIGFENYDEEKSNLESKDLLPEIAKSFIDGQMRDLLNNLEYFAMYFTHNLADESVVFQSLHQSYFEVVETMYYNISSHNTTPNHKYYVNVIELYKNWIKRDDKNQQDIETAKQAYNNSIQKQDLGTISKNIS